MDSYDGYQWLDLSEISYAETIEILPPKNMGFLADFPFIQF